jgi:pimeloyl-ACP methyl ester carboxylesterase
MPDWPNEMEDTAVATARLDVAGAQLEYRLDRSAAPAFPRPIVFLHEGLGSLRQWRDFPREISHRLGGATTLTYSRHGYGTSDRRPSAPTNLDLDLDCEAAEVLPAVLAALDLPCPVLVGHSDGATIAAMFAAAGHPAAGLVLMAPHVFIEPQTLDGMQVSHERYQAGPLRESLARHHRQPEAMFRAWHGTWLRLADAGWSIEDRLAAVATPTLAIQGLDDRYGTLRQLDAVARLTSGSIRRVELPHTGHAPHLERPALTASIISAFLRRLPSIGKC